MNTAKLSLITALAMKRILLGIFLFELLCTPVFAATDEENAAHEALEIWVTTMKDYLAATPTSSGPVPGATELMAVVQNGPDLVCGISIVMVRDARLGLILRYNKASDNGDTESVKKLADLMGKLQTLSERLEVACTNYFDAKAGIIYGESGAAGEEEEDEEEEEEDINSDDLRIAREKVKKVKDVFEPTKSDVIEYLENYGLLGWLLKQPDLNSSDLDKVWQTMEEYRKFLEAKIKELEQTIWAAYNLKIGSEGRIAVFKLVNEIESELIDTMFLLEYLRIKMATVVIEEFSSTIPPNYTLDQNYPNPFNSGTVICFALPQNDHVHLAIYNLAGQRVATLVNGLHQAGTYTIRWDGRDDQGRALASGVYLYRLRAGPQQVATRKLLVLQ